MREISGGAPIRFGKLPDECDRVASTVNVRLHVRLDVAGLRVRGIRDRRVRAADRRVASVELAPHRIRAGRAGTGAVRKASGRRADPPLGSRHAIHGLYKAEVIHRQSRKNPEIVELATLTCVDWFNHRRLLEPIGNIPPAEAEANYYRQTPALPKAA
jgi:hypothetical protein